VRVAVPALLALVVLAPAGCGGSSSSGFPTIQPARTYELTGFEPAGTVRAGRPTTVSFVIRQPSGEPLTQYKHGPGPHTGIHLIIVRSDLGAIIHRHPPVAADGRTSERVVFPTPGRYRMVVDAYPATTGPQTNFQLFRWITVAGRHVAQPLPPFRRSEVVGGYRFTIEQTPHLHAIQAALLKVDVAGPDGKPASFTPWYGALAHAIFFRKGSLDYFHTHVCAPGATGCASVFGGASVTGRSSTPGRLTVGVLVPVPGTWRLFLQCKIGGRILTAPFTLRVAA
jgi:hypothetical protein